MFPARNRQGQIMDSESDATVPITMLKVATSFGSSATETTCAISEYSDPHYDRSPQQQYRIQEEEDNTEEDDEEYDQFSNDISLGVRTWDDSSSSDSITILSHDECCRSPSLRKLQPSAIVDETEGAVCFGWIRHKTTERWRDVVKIFSDDRKRYPSWNKEICKQVLALLEQEGIVRFLVCRGDKCNREKIHKGGCLGKRWRIATPEQILAKTKQRFTDDRKPPPPPRLSPTGLKPPRGRPPKIRVPMVSPGSQLHRDPSIGNDLAFNMANSTKSNHLIRLGQLSQEMESLRQNFACNQTETLLDNVQAGVASQVDPILPFHLEMPCLDSEPPSNSSLPFLDDEPPTTGSPPLSSNETNLNIGPSTCSEREVWYPIEYNHVCFDWNNHHGTDRWNEVVREMAGNIDEYPEWNDIICYIIKKRLAEEGIHYFCSFLDPNGHACTTIFEGLWYRASDEEILEKTKLEFLLCRCLLEAAASAFDPSLGSPPSGGLNGFGPTSNNFEDSDDPSSHDRDNEGDVSGQSSRGFSSTGHHQFCHQFNLTAEVLLLKSNIGKDQGTETGTVKCGLESNPEDDNSSVNSDADKNSVDEAKHQNEMKEAELLCSSKQTYRLSPARLLEKAQIFGRDDATLTFESALVNDRQTIRPELFDSTAKVQDPNLTLFDESLKLQNIVPPPPSLSLSRSPGAVRVSGLSYVQQDADDDRSTYDGSIRSIGEVRALVAEVVDEEQLFQELLNRRTHDANKAQMVQNLLCHPTDDEFIPSTANAVVTAVAVEPLKHQTFRRSLRSHFFGPLKFIRKSLRRRRTTMMTAHSH